MKNHKNHILLKAASASLTLCALAGGARASDTITYAAVPQSGTIMNGATNVLNMFLQETLTGGTTSAIAADAGLYDGGVGFVEKAGGTGVTVTAAAANNAAEPNGFSGNDFAGVLTSGGGYIQDITGNSATKGVTPFSSTTVGSTTTNLYLLGTMTLSVSANPNATFLMESLHDTPQGQGAVAAGSNGNSATYGNDFDLDVGGAGNLGVVGANGHAVNFAVTPEPSGILLLALGAAGLASRRRPKA